MAQDLDGSKPDLGAPTPQAGGRAGDAAPSPLPRVPRKRRRSMLVLAVLLVGTGALIATYLVDAMSDRVAVIVLARDVPVGTQITRDQLGTAKVSVEPAVQSIPARQIDEVVGQIARVDLHRGTMLSAAQLTGQATPAPGQQVVSAPLKRSQVPARGLRPGDAVLVIATAGTSGGAPGSSQDPPSSSGDGGAASGQPDTTATVDRVGEADADGVLVVDLLVSDSVGPAIARQAAAGRVALILTARRP